MKTLNRPKRTLRTHRDACQGAIDKIKASFKQTSDIKSKIQLIQEQKDEFDKALELIEKWEKGEL
jgi:hypothetical protein